MTDEIYKEVHERGDGSWKWEVFTDDELVDSGYEPTEEAAEKKAVSIIDGMKYS